MKRKIAVIRGGPSSEHEVSIKTGRTVIDVLNEKHQTVDIIIDKKGNWLHAGKIVTPAQIGRRVDVIFNALHGEYGEDGQVQNLLETLGVKFTGPKKLGAALSMNKSQTKDIYKKFGIKTPLYKVFDKNSNQDVNKIAIEIFRTFPMPVVVKPVGLGSSVGITIARDYKSLLESLISLFIRYDKIMIEEYIKGKEATVGVVDNFRNKKFYAMLPIEINIPKEKVFFDYEAKYTGISEEKCPGSFNSEESFALQQMAETAHEILGLRHYSRTDFIVHPKRGIYALETNSLPGLTKESLMPKSFEPIGTNYREFLEHVIELALRD